MRATPLAGAAALAVLLLAGCGDDGDAAPVPEADESTVVAHGNDRLQWDQDRYEAVAGEIEFVLVNDGNLPHTLLIEDADGEDSQVGGLKLTVGSVDRGSVELDPGEYVLWCDIPGHRNGGMEADLVVG